MVNGEYRNTINHALEAVIEQIKKEAPEKFHNEFSETHRKFAHEPKAYGYRPREYGNHIAPYFPGVDPKPIYELEALR